MKFGHLSNNSINVLVFIQKTKFIYLPAGEMPVPSKEKRSVTVDEIPFFQ